jgi:RsiW-degrading membrane proteinase PrsW (M82 family)
MTLSLLILIFIGIFPAILWLFFFLRKDVHPEPNSMVIKVFLFGALATFPTFFIEVGVREYLNFYFENFDFIEFISICFFAPLIEEFMKYLVVMDKVLKSPELDEPADLILYMIISALGFAAIENTFQILQFEILPPAILVSFFRFWGAIFLHALASGLLGYFLALSFFFIKKSIKLKTLGFGLAFFLHSLFNFSIIGIGKNMILTEDGKIVISKLFNFSFYFILICSILIGLATFVSFGFKRLEKTKSICKII